mmetsp:Transcript_31893/g.58589  ORF Transcript_31893/g.58589 Transcript_31893/m.58589 type:complete len:207 (+) Transcript_31893:490-1110(+)
MNGDRVALAGGNDLQALRHALAAVEHEQFIQHAQSSFIDPAQHHGFGTGEGALGGDAGRQVKQHHRLLALAQLADGAPLVLFLVDEGDEVALLARVGQLALPGGAGGVVPVHLLEPVEDGRPPEPGVVPQLARAAEVDHGAQAQLARQLPHVVRGGVAEEAGAQDAARADGRAAHGGQVAHVLHRVHAAPLLICKIITQDGRRAFY